MYKKVQTDMSFVEREKETLQFWKDNDIFRKSVASREGCPAFTFFDGPPTANGRPHIGHILTRVIKDIIPRYKTMKGYKVPRKAGWDTHGLPVELEVEKLLGIDGKAQIEAYGVEPFIEKCKESVWKYKTEWEDMSDRVGFWADMDDPYVTYDNNYIESEWWALRKIWDAGLLYKGHKIVPYCPRCGTSLSSHEVAQGYKDVKDMSVFVRFGVKGEPETYFAAWTTTPWTLPSNVALCVNPDVDYSLVEVDSSIEGDPARVRYFIASELATKLFGEAEMKVISTSKGVKLQGMEYTPLFSYGRNQIDASGKKAFYITCDDYVTLSDGTGIVHIAPAFGEDDSRVGRKYNLPFVQLVDTEGKMTIDAEEFAGVFCKDADPGLIRKLALDKKLVGKLPYEHSYPFCWRCDTALIYYARDTWFIEMTKVKDKLLVNNKTINWMPETIRDGRFGNFLENVIDWGISRERYWGTPLPIWECECGHRHLIGSIDELKALSDDCPDEIELHKPYIDAVHVKCEKCGSSMKRVSEVIDCWFDSGSMPFAQWHYPFENKELFDEQYPADFISEAVDQTRGWFYTLLAISTLLFDNASFRNCIVLGLVLDKDGIKMSKHKGNVVDPWEVIDKQGADAVRWYFYTASSPWLPSRFSPEAVTEVQRKFMGTLWNTYAFYVMYANIDNFTFDPEYFAIRRNSLPVIDKWLLSRLNTLTDKVDKCLDKYDITTAARAIADFTDELSNWYVRRNRERFWAEGMEEDKIDAYSTLYTSLTELAKLCAPFVPFMAESIYGNLVLSTDPDMPESVHLCDFPVCDQSMIDKVLEQNMNDVLHIVAMGRAARNNCSIKNRQPVSKMYIKSPRRLPEEYDALVADELNVKEIVYIDDISQMYGYQIKPQLKTLGRKMGKLIPAITSELKNIDGKAAFDTIKTIGKIQIVIDGDTIELSEDDLLIETVQMEGLSTESDRDFTVSIDTVLTDELIEEGFVREIVSKVQTMRKEAGFEVLDRIVLGFDTDDHLGKIITENSGEIRDEVLANDILNELSGFVKEWDVNGIKAKLSVRKV